MTCRTHTEPIEGFDCVATECVILDAEPGIAQAYVNRIVNGPLPEAIDLARKLRNPTGMTTEEILDGYRILEAHGYMYWKDGEWRIAPNLTN